MGAAFTIVELTGSHQAAYIVVVSFRESPAHQWTSAISSVGDLSAPRVRSRAIRTFGLVNPIGPAVSGKRVQHLRPAGLEVAFVPGHDDQIVCPGRGRAHAVEQQHRPTATANPRHEACPLAADRRSPWQALDGLDQRIEPLFEPLPLPTPGKTLHLSSPS